MHLYMTVSCGYTAERFRLVVCPVTVFTILEGVVPVMLRQHHLHCVSELICFFTSEFESKDLIATLWKTINMSALNGVLMTVCIAQSH